MQDRFKFRVYHKPTNKIYNVYGFNDDFVFIDTLDTCEPFFRADCILLQCTGLKDKNGKLIYEGDILYVEVIDWKAEERWKAGKVNTYWSVAYKDYENRSGFMVFGKDRRFNKPLTKAVIFNSKASVIGNIHENEDLLENKDE